MANTVSLLSYANTFGDWVVTTNALIRENNDLASNNYTKRTGTLYLNSPTLGLQVANNAVIAGQLQVQGIGSSAYVQNNLRVDTQVYFQNTILGLTNSGELISNGKISAGASSVGLAVANNATIGGSITIGNSLSVAGPTVISNTITVTKSAQFSNTIFVSSDALISGNLNAGNYLNVTKEISSLETIRGYGLSIIGNGNVTGEFSVGGNFVINGSTVYSTNVFTLNAGSSVGLTSEYSVNRGTSGANASIRWNETSGFWDIRDVNNSASYSKILTANLISNSVNSISTSTLASSLAANTLDTSIRTANTFLQTRYDATTNVIYARANTSSNTFIGTTGSAQANLGVITLTSTNGVTLVGSSNTITVNTPQDVRTTASPTFNSLTLTAPLAISQGGTGSTSAGAALTNLLPSASGVPAGYVLATGGVGTYYWAAGGTGGGSSALPGTTIASTRISYLANGTGLSYSTPVYVAGASQLRVYFDGVRQFASGYTEASGNTSGSGIVTFTNSPPSGTNILIEVDGYYVNPYYANNISFTAPFGSIASSANTIQLAIQDLETRKAALANPTFTGNPLAPTAATSVSNTQIATTAFVNNMANSGITFTHNISGTATNITAFTINQSVGTGNNVQHNSLGIGTTASGTAGEIRATNNITAYYSDDRLKTRLGNIENALDKLMTLNGFKYQANETAQALGYKVKPEIGLSAQEVQAVLPEVVVPAPIDEKYLTIHYERVIPLLVEAIKELKAEIDTIKGSK